MIENIKWLVADAKERHTKVDMTHEVAKVDQNYSSLHTQVDIVFDAVTKLVEYHTSLHSKEFVHLQGLLAEVKEMVSKLVNPSSSTGSQESISQMLLSLETCLKTKVDLSELIHAPFHNPNNDTIAWSLKNFLETKVKNNFKGLKTASSFTKKAKGVIDPRTNKTMVNVMWQSTKQAKRIPLPKRLPEGTLDSMQLWVYDEATATVVIKLKKNQFRIVDPKDLLKFGERDIHTLSNFQIIVENELFEAAAKAFTGMVATTTDKKLWAGTFDQGDVHLVEKP
ncbi:unnamed protein product [Lactuca saligna]|uniref:Uncharacterized protein n=1 Tax=Lactuca saligna TaxID=75948 RepID=A0AA35YSR0_LACSI|nr:unnamed protein product [Lactuca saligna]